MHKSDVRSGAVVSLSGVHLHFSAALYRSELGPLLASKVAEWRTQHPSMPPATSTAAPTAAFGSARSKISAAARAPTDSKAASTISGDLPPAVFAAVVVPSSSSSSSPSFSFASRREGAAIFLSAVFFGAVSRTCPFIVCIIRAGQSDVGGHGVGRDKRWPEGEAR